MSQLCEAGVEGRGSDGCECCAYIMGRPSGPPCPRVGGTTEAKRVNLRLGNLNTAKDAH